MSTTFIQSVKEHGERFWMEAANEVLIIAVTDLTGKILYANDRFCKISGYSHDELVGANHRILNSGTHDRAFFHNMFRTIHAGRTWSGEICNRAKDGNLYWVATTIIPEVDATSKICQFVSCRFDITEQKRAEQKLQEMVVTDALTGLQNRRGFQIKFDELLTQAQAQGDELAVLMLDIDNFKDINDVNGHELGDLFLQKVARRLQISVAPSDLIARLDGDEIAIVLPLGARNVVLDQIIQGLQDAVREPVGLVSSSVTASASIGLALYPGDGSSAQDLIKCADVALYHAKRAGKNRCSHFAPVMLARTKRRVANQEQAFLSLAAGEFELYYQPIIKLQGHEPASCEALLRWRHPKDGLISPPSFAEVFENHQLSAMIGEFVQGAVIAQACKWQEEGVPFQKIEFNTTTADFENPGFAKRLILQLQRHNLSVDRVGVEVTEGMFLGQHSDSVQHELRLLTDARIETAFDDFGTGYASLTHLKELPITRIKVDRSFITHLATDVRDRKIVGSVIELANSLNISVTAEGVENREQLEILSRLNCDRIQGYLISKPRPAEDMPALLDQLFNQTLEPNWLAKFAA